MTEKKLVKKVLVATDGSEHAEKAVDYALELAGACGAEVQILSVVPPVHAVCASCIPPITAAPTETPIERKEKSVKSVISRALKKAREKNPGLKVSTKLVKGYPPDRIVDAAKGGGFDLIVVGSRGLGNVKEVVLGGVSDRVADKAHCPVLIVK